MENTLDNLTLKEVAGILRCSKAHALNVIEGRVRGLPKLPHLNGWRRTKRDRNHGRRSSQ
jgi:hypothetical protein